MNKKRINIAIRNITKVHTTKSQIREIIINQITAETDPILNLLFAAKDALRSYQYGNFSPDLAKEVADKIEEFASDWYSIKPKKLNSEKFMGDYVEEELLIRNQRGFVAGNKRCCTSRRKK